MWTIFVRHIWGDIFLIFGPLVDLSGEQTGEERSETQGETPGETQGGNPSGELRQTGESSCEKVV